jgi:methyltransferase
MTAAVFLLTAVTMERLAELWFARRNTTALMAKGAHEVAHAHYPLIVLMHTLWLTGLWAFGWEAPVNLGWLAVFMALQGARVWVLMTLGRRWTTRVIVSPGAPLITTGPYRFLSHPNYMVVIGEIAVLPLCLGLPGFGLVFSIANLALLAVRVRAENEALLGSREYNTLN